MKRYVIRSLTLSTTVRSTRWHHWRRSTRNVLRRPIWPPTAHRRLQLNDVMLTPPI